LKQMRRKNVKRITLMSRSRMGNNRLSGLVLLHVYRDIKVNTDAIIERFAKQKNRKRTFIL